MFSFLEGRGKPFYPNMKSNFSIRRFHWGGGGGGRCENILPKLDWTNKVLVLRQRFSHDMSRNEPKLSTA